MDTFLVQQMRREILARLQFEGGQASWRSVLSVEYEVLQQMVQDGLIEPLDDLAEPSRLTFRLKPEDFAGPGQQE